MLAKLAYAPAMSAGSRWILSLRSPGSTSGWCSSSMRPRYYWRMELSLRLRQTLRLITAVAATLAAGTVGFHLLLDESWFQALYRSVVTATLAGLDTVPRSDGARLLSIGLVLAGLTIIAYTGAVIVEVIA